MRRRRQDLPPAPPLVPTAAGADSSDTRDAELSILSAPQPEASLLSPAFYLALTAYLCLLLLYLLDLNQRLPSPYMDEPFHLQQTRLYCRHDFSQWDPLITTLPGLYLASLAVTHVIAPVRLLINSPSPFQSAVPTEQPVDLCSLPFLRFYNLLYAGCAFTLYFLLVGHLHPLSPLHRRIVSSMRFGLLPLFLFYTPLYYTDTASVAAVLFMLYTALSREGVSARPSPAAWLSSPAFQLLACAVAVMMRQTNIVWVVFTAAFVLLRRFQPPSYSPECIAVAGDRDGPLLPSAVAFAQWLLSPHELAAAVQLVWPHAVTVLGFIVFLVWNGGSVVVGDRSHHAFTPHCAQLLYFSAFASAALAPTVLLNNTVPAFLTSALSSPSRILLTLCSLLLVAATVQYFSFAHPFLLADNRHVTFYLWRHLLSRWRLLLSPVYLLTLYAVQRLMRHHGVLVRCLLWLCAAVALIPSPLLELRYFVTPLAVLMLLAEGGLGGKGREDVGMGEEEGRHRAALLLVSDVLLCLGYAAVDVGMAWLFLYRPYRWDDGSTARFMW